MHKGIREVGSDWITLDPATEAKFFSENSGELQMSTFQLRHNVCQICHLKISKETGELVIIYFS